jgi:hypothetical protein
VSLSFRRPKRGEETETDRRQTVYKGHEIVQG